MLLEDQRFLHEDLERLEQGISDRILEDHKHVRGLLIGCKLLSMLMTYC